MSIFVDGSFAFGMPIDAALELGIRTGFELDQELLERCLDADESYRARQRALSLLAHRARSEAELRQRLAMAGFSATAVADAIDRMSALGHLDDARFAMAFARDRLLVGGFGPRRVLAQLRKKGVAPGIAQEAIDAASSKRDELEDALQLAQKRARALNDAIDPRRRRERLYGHLARRGFEPETIREALRRLEMQIGTEDADSP